jgi:phage tail-like protein
MVRSRSTRPSKCLACDIVVSLLNEEHMPVMVWKAHNAFPVKVEGPGLKASGNEVAIESIEIAHEGLELQNE